MVSKTSLALPAGGVALMALGIAEYPGPEIGMMAFVLGFVLTVSGMGIAVRDATKADPKTTEDGASDSPAMIRAVGVGVGLASLATPYFRSPVVGANEAAQSVVDIVVSASAGVETSVSLVVLILVVVVFAGSFLSVFHHMGGYVMLLGGMTMVFILMQQTGNLEAVTRELGYGLYLMLLAAFIIISSALSDTSGSFDSDSDWSSKLLVMR